MEFDDAGILNEKPELLTNTIVGRCPLHTSDDLYGGRIDAMRLHYKVSENGRIQYVDVLSLYPYVFKYFNFPIGHPIIHGVNACKNKKDCLRMKRLIECLIVPPNVLYHPVLPFKINNKPFSVNVENAFLNGTSPGNGSILPISGRP